MTNARSISWQADVLQRVGMVQATPPGGLTLRFDDGETCEAVRAVSCLVAPEVGDVVLVVASARGVYVLAVLERPSPSAVRVEVDGDLELRAAGGAMRLRATRGVELTSAESVRAVAPRVEAVAVEAAVSAQRIAVAGDALEATLATAHAVVGEIDLRAMKLVSRARWSLRHVEETDHLRAGRIDHSAETILRMRAKNALVQVTSLVKVDGAQIQLG
jgi:hypothetical protein